MSTSTFLFPDVNVWLALTHDVHPQHEAAVAWGALLEEDTTLYFCRFTQLGLLRLLTNRSAMGSDALTQVEAWKIYDAFLKNSSTQLLDEPRGMSVAFRRRTSRDEISTKQWADGYLAAFAEAASLRLVTFDRALAGRVIGSLLLVS